MPGDDADFAAYLAARWPFLVRSLVLTGLSPAQAEDVALSGLARCRAAWRRMQEVDDVDAHVYGIVFDKRPAPVGAPVAPADPNPSEAELLLGQLVEQLAALTAEQRDAVVLSLVAGLDEGQVADVLDAPVGTVRARVADGLGLIEPAALRSEAAFRTAAAAIDVSPDPYDGVVARSRQQRRRRLRIVAASVAVGAVVLGGGTWLTSRPEAAEPAPRVVPSRNPLDISWYDGRLHLRQVTVELPGLTSLAGIGEGVVFVDTAARVGLVSPAGDVEIVGRASAGSTVLGSGENAWAAWLEPGEDRARLVVWSVGAGEEVGSIDVAPDTRLIAIDQDRVYAEDASGAFTWEPTESSPERLPEGDLADVGSATRVYQRGSRIEMVQPFFTVSFIRPGEGAVVSPGGNFVLTHAPGASGVPGSPYTPRIYDTRSGDRIPSGVSSHEVVVDAAFGNNHQIDYLVADVSDLQGVDLDGARARLYVLRTCELEANTCSDVAPVRSAADRPLFAP
jgi:hypothetical protein